MSVTPTSPTLNQIKTQFNQTVAMQNPEVDPYVTDTDWDVYGTALAALLSSSYQDIQTLSNAMFIQFASGLFLDYAAFSYGLPPRSGATLATATAVNSPPSTAGIYPQGTTFLSAFNGKNYVLTEAVTILNAPQITVFPLQAIVTGSGNAIPVSSTLTTTALPPITITVISSADGSDAESDSQLRSFLLQTIQNPVGGGREGQYIALAVETPNVGRRINNAIVIPYFFPNKADIGIFCISGNLNYDDVLLNQTTQTYSLTASASDVQAAYQFIQAQKVCDSIIYVSSVSTYVPQNKIVIAVVLANNLTLSSQITNLDGSDITVENMILQEFRRGFITYPYQGTIVGNTQMSFILKSRLEQTLDSGLSVNGGIYAQILITRTITIFSIATPTQTIPDIPVPYRTLDTNNNFISVYDIIGTPSGTDTPITIIAG